eukprot:318805-Alexandrium_andersonii.AAC.1
MAEETELTGAELLSAYLFEAEDWPGSAADEQAIDQALREVVEAAEATRQAPPAETKPVAGWWISPDGSTQAVQRPTARSPPRAQHHRADGDPPLPLGSQIGDW